MDTGTTPLLEACPAGFPAALVAGRVVSLQLFIAADKENGQKIEPLHRHRHKVIFNNGKPTAMANPDPLSRVWEEYVAEYVIAQLMTTPTQGAGEDFVLPLKEVRVLMNLRFNLPKPKTYPARVVDHTKRPDIDNYAKGVIDGLVKARIIEDDGLITDLSVQKRYVAPGHPEGVEIDLTAMPTEVP